MEGGIGVWPLASSGLGRGWRLLDHPSSTARLEGSVAQRESCGTVPRGGVPRLQPCDPDTKISLLCLALSSQPEDVELEDIVDLVAQLVSDLWAWPDGP